jgi:hypothetical protein
VPYVVAVVVLIGAPTRHRVRNHDPRTIDLHGRAAVTDHHDIAAELRLPLLKERPQRILSSRRTR